MSNQQKRQCSELFARVFDSHGGGCRRKCVCGREHFDGSSQGGWTWEKGELEDLREQSAQFPDRFVEHDGTVGCMAFAGVEIVYDCPCDRAQKYERFIESHAELLAEYLRGYATEFRRLAEAVDVPVVPETPSESVAARSESVWREAVKRTRAVYDNIRSDPSEVLDYLVSVVDEESHL